MKIFYWKGWGDGVLLLRKFFVKIILRMVINYFKDLEFLICLRFVN